MMKKLFGILTFIILGFNFGYCDTVLPTDSWDGNHIYEGIFDYYGEYMTFDSPTKVSFSYPNLSFVCFKKRYQPQSANNGNGMYSLDGINWIPAFSHEIGCVSSDSELWFKGGEIIFSYFIYGDGYVQPLWTSLTCQQTFDLIPVSEVDSEYCENNNLCSQVECTGGLSTLYINDIRHESMPFIYVNIPEEFKRDYSTGINDFTVDIEGYNVDTEYISGIIDTQKNKPSQTDFNNIITDIIPLFVPGLVIILFIYFVFRLLKKIF